VRLVPRGFVHLVWSRSIQLQDERLARTVSWCSRHSQSGMAAPRAVRSFEYSGEINRTMAEDLALTCSVVFAVVGQRCCVRWSDNA
jgi:hypothetical protein